MLISSNKGAINTIIYAYMIPVIMLVILIFILKFNHLFNKKQTKLFFSAVIVNLIMMAITGTDLILSQNRGTPFGYFRSITTFLNFALGPLVPLFLFQIFNKVKGKYWLYIPFLVNIILCFISIFTYMIFKVTPDNSYGRGPLFFVPFVVSIFYTLLIVLYPSHERREGRNKERIFIIFIVVILVTCLLLEVFTGLHCLLYAASAGGLILYYVLQNILSLMTDSLTGVYNRQMYNHKLEKAKKYNSCLVAIADLNNLKIINDTFGHEAGDYALKQVAKSLHFYSSSIAQLYRIGGDEFVLISLKGTREQLNNCLERSEKEVEKKGYSFAWGIAEYRAGEDMQEVLRLADKEMYQKKKNMAMAKEHVLSEID